MSDPRIEFYGQDEPTDAMRLRNIESDIQRIRDEQSVLISELREAVHTHAQTISAKEAVLQEAMLKIADLETKLATSLWQTAEWRTQANQLTVANDEKANKLNKATQRIAALERIRVAVIEIAKEIHNAGNSALPQS